MCHTILVPSYCCHITRSGNFCMSAWLSHCLPLTTACNWGEPERAPHYETVHVCMTACGHWILNYIMSHKQCLDIYRMCASQLSAYWVDCMASKLLSRASARWLFQRIGDTGIGLGICLLYVGMTSKAMSSFTCIQQGLDCSQTP